jgi:hypothetical protein
MANQAETEIMRAGLKWHQDLVKELTAKIETLQSEQKQANGVWAAEYECRIETIRRLQELAIKQVEKLELQLDTQAM